MSKTFKSDFIIRLIILMLVLLAAVNISGCKEVRTQDEQLVIDRLRPFWGPLEDYKRENFYYPDTWDQLLRFSGLEMPENPYTGEPMVVLDSLDFDPEISPGNIFYIRVMQDEGVINCQVAIFGESGEIARYGHGGPLAAK